MVAGAVGHGNPRGRIELTLKLSVQATSLRGNLVFIPFARQFLPREGDCPTLVNADLIADGLSPFDPSRAAIRSGRLMLQLIGEHFDRRESFAFEWSSACSERG